MIRTIKWSPRWRTDLADISRETKHSIRVALERRVQLRIERLACGEGDVLKITGIDPPLFRMRVSIWRVLFRHDGEEIVFLRIRPSEESYRR